MQMKISQMFREIGRKTCLDSFEAFRYRKMENGNVAINRVIYVHCCVATENIDKHRSNTFLEHHPQGDDNKKKKKKSRLPQAE